MKLPLKKWCEEGIQYVVIPINSEAEFNEAVEVCLKSGLKVGSKKPPKAIKAALGFDIIVDEGQEIRFSRVSTTVVFENDYKDPKIKVFPLNCITLGLRNGKKLSVHKGVIKNLKKMLDTPKD